MNNIYIYNFKEFLLKYKTEILIATKLEIESNIIIHYFFFNIKHNDGRY